jgi:hypothetical protein
MVNSGGQRAGCQCVGGEDQRRGTGDYDHVGRPAGGDGADALAIRELRSVPPRGEPQARSAEPPRTGSGVCRGWNGVGQLYGWAWTGSLRRGKLDRFYSVKSSGLAPSCLPGYPARRALPVPRGPLEPVPWAAIPCVGRLAGAAGA